MIISFQPWKYVHLSVVIALFIWVILFKCIGTKKKSGNCEIPLDIFIYVATYSAVPIAHWAWLQGTVCIFGQYHLSSALLNWFKLVYGPMRPTCTVHLISVQIIQGGIKSTNDKEYCKVASIKSVYY